MSYSEELARRAAALGNLVERIHDGVVRENARSIVEGSELTGTQGQPVDEGDLVASWDTHELGPQRALIATDSPYARAVEDNWDGVTYHRGGSHNVKGTLAGEERIVRAVVEQETAGGLK